MTPSPTASVGGESTPPASPTSSPTPAYAAELEVTGRGSCHAINYGGCWPVFLLRSVPARSLFDWTPTDDDIEFDAEQGYPERTLTGPLINGPRSIAAGHWAVGLGLGASSDVVGTPNSGAVICVREFDVTELTERVAITAQFDQPCRIDIELEPASPDTPIAQPVPVHWDPPTVGIMDDCRGRSVILHVDQDGRPWYEDVASGERIEIATPEFDGWTVTRRGINVELVGPDGAAVPEFDVTGVSCVFEAGELAWFGGPDVAWEPWERALGSDAGSVAKYLVEDGRGHPGGPPPTAVTIASALSSDLDEAALLKLDDEIGVSGAAWRSASVPGVFVGNRNAMTLALGGYCCISPELEWQWMDLSGVHERVPGVAGWSSQRVRMFVTPGGNTVWAIGERLTAFDDCSTVVVPPIRTDGVDVLESGIDVGGGIVDLRLFGEGGADTQVVADFRDERCRSHAVLGPIIDHLLADEDPPVSPMPPAPARWDLKGRLAAGAPGCPVLIADDGTTWRLDFPGEYPVEHGATLQVFDQLGNLLAAEGDVLAVHGLIESDVPGECMVGHRIYVTGIVFVEPARPAPAPSPSPNPVAEVCGTPTLSSLRDEHGDVIVAFIDRVGGLLAITASSEFEAAEKITVSYNDPECVAHPLVGPIIRGALEGYGAQPSEYEDRVGRLIVTDAAARCSVLLTAEGWTMNLLWPRAFELTETGIVGAHGEIVARAGDLIRVVGTERREVSKACVEDWSIAIREVVALP